MPFFLIIGALLGAAVVIHFWDDIRESVADWLRARGLAKSKLMDAWILLDRLVSGVRCRLYAKTRQTGTVEVKETHLSMDQIDDPEVLKRLKRNGQSQYSVMEYVE